MKESSWQELSKIYLDDVNIGIATFQNSIPTYNEWNNDHVKSCILVSKYNRKVLGFIELSPI